ncbi:immunoglobulin-like domain-containing protein [Cohnella luojiensis]|uniref:immunoglobulin-like domain-containing protein n=1 Tax=Cohnella luojiensis TaxID=652876 RepID=UPI003B82DB61
MEHGYQFNNDWSWTLQGYSASPEQDFTQEITIDKLEPGKYRISKGVEVAESGSSTSLSDTFEITG